MFRGKLDFGQPSSRLAAGIIVRPWPLQIIRIPLGWVNRFIFSTTSLQECKWFGYLMQLYHPEYRSRLREEKIKIGHTVREDQGTN